VIHRFQELGIFILNFFVRRSQKVTSSKERKISFRKEKGGKQVTAFSQLIVQVSD